jgi:MFS family permease
MSLSFRTLRSTPSSVWALGFVSLLMDLSSEMIHGLLPVFMTVGLGASIATVGMVEGIAEATAAVTKVFSGWLSDRIGQRKLLAGIGYGLAAASKPLFVVANSVGLVLFARFADRVGKGIRGAPRDALIADITEPGQRGAAFGLRQSLDTIGAFLGPAVAIGLMFLLHDNLRLVFALAAVPAAAAVLLIVFGVQEPKRTTERRRAKSPIAWSEIGALGAPCWRLLALATVFSLARFSEAFLILRGQTDGIGPEMAPAVMILMNIVYAVLAAPAGALSDTLDRRMLLALGLAALIGSDLVLGLGGGLPAIIAGVALWGAHMALTQGLFSAMIADAAPPALRGTAFGLYNLAGGVAMLIASAGFGTLWTVFGPPVAFLVGAGVGATVLAGLWLVPKAVPAAG